MDKRLTELVEILHREKCSCVLLSGGRIILGHERGVSDLYRMLTETPETLNCALIADKVVGKGAAALMILGRVKEIYADTISQPALDLLNAAGVAATYGTCAANIINRAGTGICPVESLCHEAPTAADCLPLIAGFLKHTKQNI